MDMTRIIGARPVGTQRNREVLSYLEQVMGEMGYYVDSLEASCQVWEREESRLNDQLIHPSPFSLSVRGRFPVTSACSPGELFAANIAGSLLLLYGDIAREPLMPKHFPFYYPDEHREINDYLEAQQPAAVIALTEKHPLCGLHPFPLFEDSSFSVPTAYAQKELLADIGSTAELVITSSRRQEKTSQLTARRQRTPSQSPVVLCAHMDTKYNTPGAVDNAAGVALMLASMQAIADTPGKLDDLECLPFNGEEYCGVPGELAYLEHLKRRSAQVRLLVNIDGALYKDAPIGLSWYNLSPPGEAIIRDFTASQKEFSIGDPWYAGDHSIWAFQGIPCIAAYAADAEGVLSVSHTEHDTIECIDLQRIDTAGAALADLLVRLSEV